MATKHNIITDYDSNSPFFTEIRRLLLKITHNSKNEEIKSLMVTSAILSEGKSTTSALLALTAARSNGLKTLLFDADMRKPSVHKLFGVERIPGLIDIIKDGYNSKEAIKKTNIDKLDILTAGSYCENPTDVFDAEAISFLIDEMKFYYDLIIIDTPPVLPVSDPLLLSSKVDSIAFIIKAGSTSRDVVSRGIEILSNARHKILGVVLNNSDHTLPYFYDYSYLGYQYKMDRPDQVSKILNPQNKKDSNSNLVKKESIMKKSENL